MDTQWVEVLHRSHREATVVGIADALKLNLLPALQTLFNQNLRCEGEGALCQLDKLLLVWTDTRTETTQGVSRTDHDGEADLVGCLQGILHRLHSVAYRHLQIHLTELLYEEVAILSVHDSLYART